MSGQPVAVRNVRTDARFARDIAESTGYVPTAILAAPFFDSAGEVVGVLEVLDPGIATSGDWPLTVLGMLASQLAAIVAGAGPSDSRQRYLTLGRRWPSSSRRTADVPPSGLVRGVRLGPPA